MLILSLLFICSAFLFCLFLLKAHYANLRIFTGDISTNVFLISVSVDSVLARTVSNDWYCIHLDWICHSSGGNIAARWQMFVDNEIFFHNHWQPPYKLESEIDSKMDWRCHHILILWLCKHLYFWMVQSMLCSTNKKFSQAVQITLVEVNFEKTRHF